MKKYTAALIFSLVHRSIDKEEWSEENLKNNFPTLKNNFPTLKNNFPPALERAVQTSFVYLCNKVTLKIKINSIRGTINVIKTKILHVKMKDVKRNIFNYY